MQGRKNNAGERIYIASHGSCARGRARRVWTVEAFASNDHASFHAVMFNSTLLPTHHYDHDYHDHHDHHHHLEVSSPPLQRQVCLNVAPSRRPGGAAYRLRVSWEGHATHPLAHPREIRRVVILGVTA